MQTQAQFFKVLADDVRLKMLWLLFNHEELCVCDFVAALEITQSKASRHLRSLLHGGVVNDRKEGLWSYYSLRALESELTRPHLELLRTTLAACPDALAVLERLSVWLMHNRSFPGQPTPCAKAQARRERTLKASGRAGQNAGKAEGR
ncbi:MAG: metalloregulator ArsR/SmtB family transcription factor [Proteobacteria bacterium]|jgi:ArsR family transcriptional regulator|nr:metalloregulator ArsR/SmtB family transcription factor [Pseudomonadota bacterium]